MIAQSPPFYQALLAYRPTAIRKPLPAPAHNEIVQALRLPRPLATKSPNLVTTSRRSVSTEPETSRDIFRTAAET